MSGIEVGKWTWHSQPLVATRTVDGIGEVYIMPMSLPKWLDREKVECVLIGDDRYERTAERTCRIDGSIYYDGDATHDGFYEYDLTCGHTIRWHDEEPPNYCPECGEMDPSAGDAKYCAHCGAMVVE